MYVNHLWPFPGSRYQLLYMCKIVVIFPMISSGPLKWMGMKEKLCQILSVVDASARNYCSAVVSEVVSFNKQHYLILKWWTGCIIQIMVITTHIQIIVLQTFVSFMLMETIVKRQWKRKCEIMVLSKPHRCFYNKTGCTEGVSTD